MYNSYSKMPISFLLNVFLIIACCSRADAREVIWAVNCGGGAHTDQDGVHYQADTLDVGLSSDFGRGLIIHRVAPPDQILYQTERYHVNTFGYELPVPKSGDYVLVLKFSEVWFAEPNQKVFDVVLNGEHTVVSELDIFARVGRGVAHDEVIPFSVKDGKLLVNGETSHIDGNKIALEFVKGDLDNPKINAIYLIRGTIEDVPKLPPLTGPEDSVVNDDEDGGDDEEEERGGEVRKNEPLKSRKPSGPRVKDPYASEDTSSMLLPVFAAFGAFIPLLYCLCKFR